MAFCLQTTSLKTDSLCLVSRLLVNFPYHDHFTISHMFCFFFLLWLGHAHENQNANYHIPYRTIPWKQNTVEYPALPQSIKLEYRLPRQTQERNTPHRTVPCHRRAEYRSPHHTDGRCLLAVPFIHVFKTVTEEHP